jgi:hypothetical protein
MSLVHALPAVLGAIALGGFIVCAKGFYRESYIMVIGGWLSSAVAIVVGTLWIILGHCPICAENAAVSSVFDASAACYSGSKDIRVLPIVVSELKFRAGRGL